MRATRQFAFYALGRAAYGASAASVEELQAIGFPAWVEQQLHPRAMDPVCEERIAGARLRIRYPATSTRQAARRSASRCRRMTAT